MQTKTRPAQIFRVEVLHPITHNGKVHDQRTSIGFGSAEDARKCLELHGDKVAYGGKKSFV